MMTALAAYLVIINFIGYSVMGQDKRRAQKKQRRIPEKALFIIALLGGSFGVFNAMKVYRHKTLHKRFSVGIPVLLLLQFVLILFMIL
ncbi:DUF1294 domain-containing protein [Alkalihalobacillus trypoxylicola]|uniref:DUF1294 domain-containing protein n=1 Tax=Alkalihalobacillus trypoxylicola TaxID=519424 RepID=A0A162EBJ2_9BACI|nr:DUF1294 domain-containing protein [Alkalihalobacillus trypoxylicola]KYG32222.1 hypothetical protein AZF04_05500 [Alkalihalobacillus trypoxylicola]GAF67041.1 hypothetical protein BTS2_3949 [Bacillus sp. TS-2]